MIIGLFTTMPAQPAIIVSMTAVLSEATGWSHFSVIMTSLTAWGVFPFFYQTPPVVVAVALGNLNIMDVTKMLVTYMVAGILISIATSYKLPLSTTYVTFMVAMGTSLADRAWGSESAVYRVAGVLNVIGGWFGTAIVAFTAAGVIAFLLNIS